MATTQNSQCGKPGESAPSAVVNQNRVDSASRPQAFQRLDPKYPLVYRAGGVLLPTLGTGDHALVCRVNSGDAIDRPLPPIPAIGTTPERLSELPCFLSEDHEVWRDLLKRPLTHTIELTYQPIAPGIPRQVLLHRGFNFHLGGYTPSEVGFKVCCFLESLLFQERDRCFLVSSPETDLGFWLLAVQKIYRSLWSSSRTMQDKERQAKMPKNHCKTSFKNPLYDTTKYTLGGLARERS